jgi:hypothetical protein
VFERNEQEISQIIEENLERVLSGKTSIDEVLRRHPQYAASLRRELESAVWLYSRSEQVAPRPGFIKASRKRVVEQIKQEAHSQNGKQALFGFARPKQNRVFQWAAALTVVLIILSMLGGTVSYAQNSLPGQQLYAMKRASEALAMGISIDPVHKVELSIQITDRRFNEVQELVAAGKMEYVPATLADFNQDVRQSLALLAQVNDALPAEKMVLAQRLTSNLASKAEALQILADSVPASVQVDLVSAHDLTVNGATSALAVMNEMNAVLGTLTPTGTTPPELVLPPSATPQPGKTLKPQQQKTDKVDITKTPPGSLKKPPTNTPRPTNPNRPTDSSKDPTKAPKPTKDDRPTNSNRPTRVDKPTKTAKINK